MQAYAWVGTHHSYHIIILYGRVSTNYYHYSQYHYCKAYHLQGISLLLQCKLVFVNTLIHTTSTRIVKLGFVNTTIHTTKKSQDCVCKHTTYANNNINKYFMLFYGFKAICKGGASSTLLGVCSPPFCGATTLESLGGGRILVKSGQ